LAQARTQERRGERRAPDRRKRPYRFRVRKKCNFCVKKVDSIDYKDVDLLRQYIAPRGKMRPRRKTGVCARHQRPLALAIKRARHLALLPYTAEHPRGS